MIMDPSQRSDENEAQLAEALENLSDMQLIMFALWEIHAVTDQTSNSVSEELLKRSNVVEEIAKW